MTISYCVRDQTSDMCLKLHNQGSSGTLLRLRMPLLITQSHARPGLISLSASRHLQNGL